MHVPSPPLADVYPVFGILLARAKPNVVLNLPHVGLWPKTPKFQETAKNRSYKTLHVWQHASKAKLFILS